MGAAARRADEIRFAERNLACSPRSGAHSFVLCPLCFVLFEGRPLFGVKNPPLPADGRSREDFFGKIGAGRVSSVAAVL
jgi:hypothetical protein